MCCAAALGTTNPLTCARRTATGIRRRTATTTTASVLPRPPDGFRPAQSDACAGVTAWHSLAWHAGVHGAGPHRARNARRNSVVKDDSFDDRCAASTPCLPDSLRECPVKALRASSAALRPAVTGHSLRRSVVHGRKRCFRPVWPHEFIVGRCSDDRCWALQRVHVGLLAIGAAVRAVLLVIGGCAAGKSTWMNYATDRWARVTARLLKNENITWS